jgi:hypothetical protein
MSKSKYADSIVEIDRRRATEHDGPMGERRSAAAVGTVHRGADGRRGKRPAWKPELDGDGNALGGIRLPEIT